MAADISASLFGEHPIQGSEIKFRAVCALGWQLHRRLGEFRSLCANLGSGNDDASRWIDAIEKCVIENNFAARHHATWPDMVGVSLNNAAKKGPVDALPDLGKFFQKLAEGVKSKHSLDPVFQLAYFHRRGFTMAGKMIADPLWSTGLVREKWKNAERRCQYCKGATGNFKPVTVAADNRIELRVNTGKFSTRRSLLYYLTLEFQMMHEYISHSLPVWTSGNTLEEEFLLAMMFLYYRAHCSRSGLPLLVSEAETKRRDPHRHTRVSIRDDLALGHEERLTQLLLELAVLDEDKMKRADKILLLACLKKTPFQRDGLKRTIRSWIRDCDLAQLLGRLRDADLR